MAAGKLNTLALNRLGAGNHPDGGGLYLRVIGGSRTWSFRYQRAGKSHWIGLGPVALYSLKVARDKAIDCRRRLDQGADLIAEVKAAKAPADPGRTFDDAATLYIDSHKAGWKSAKHAGQWRATLEQHAAPLLPKPVAAIGVDDVLDVLRPIWTRLPETASRLRGRIESILDYATARRWRAGDNPARWKGHLDATLPAKGQVTKVEHHAALTWQAVPDVVTRLLSSTGTGAKCAAFIILTAARSAEARGARWAEIDTDNAVWTVPAERMKGGREHRVPLSAAALAVLEAVRPLRRTDDLIFPGGKDGSPLSDVAVSKALHVAAKDDTATVHGCRSTFRDWCAEAAHAPREIAEGCLAHVNRDKVEAAYQRSDLLDRRRELMVAWAQHCAPTCK